MNDINTEQNPQINLGPVQMLELLSKETLVDYMRGSFTVLYFIFGGLLPTFTNHFNQGSCNTLQLFDNILLPEHFYTEGY